MLNAFLPQGNTSIVQGSTTASAATQPSTGSIQGFRVANLSTNDAYLAIGSSTVVAVAPTTSAAANGIPIYQRSEKTISVPPNCYVSAITTAGTANLAVTPGFGIA